MNIVIFGCGNIGFETIKLLCRSSNSLVVIDNRKPKYLKGFLKNHHRVHFYQANATKTTEVKKIYQKNFNKPGQKIDVLISTIGTTSDNTSTNNYQQFKQNFTINYFGNLVPIRSAIRLGILSTSAKIIVLSSTSGHHASDKLTAYAPSKWALESFCSSLRSELINQKITVNVLCPKTIKNKHSHVFNTISGIDPITVANKIIKIIKHPTNSNVFIPNIYSLIHIVERIFPFIFDILFRLKHRRSLSYQSPKIKSVLITGASSGLGKELAYIYSKTCHQLYLIARNQKALKLVKQTIQKNTDCKVKTYALDLALKSNLQKIVQDIDHVDMLVNNAGIHLSGTITNTSIKHYQKILDVNFFCPVFLISKLLSKQIPVKKIINVLSTTAVVGRKNLSAYSSSKSAFWCYSRATRRLFGNSVKIIEVIPATFESSLFDKGIDLSKNPAKPAARARLLSSKKVAKIIFS